MAVRVVLMAAGGFWSYTHADDDAEFGLISDLARDIVKQYELLTGESIELFLDRDSLEWGNAWADKVNGSLSNVAFFIPVLTPRFFASPECRREMRTFMDRAERLGLTELIMPIRYIDFPALSEDPQSDDLIATATKYQWEDWTDLRFKERGSGANRLAVFKMAKRLADANAAAAILPSPLPVVRTQSEGDDDSPGLMDLIAEGETVLPLWTTTIERAGELLVSLGPEFEASQQQMEAADARGQGFAGRLTATRKLANNLDPIGDEMVSLGNDFASQLSSVDAAIRAIIEMASHADGEDGVQVHEFFATIREMARHADDGLGSLQDLMGQMAPMEKMSRDLRRPFGKLRKGLTVMHEGRQIINDWVRLIDESLASSNET